MRWPLWLVMMMVLFASTAAAQTIHHISFNDVPTGTLADNLVVDGVRFSSVPQWTWAVRDLHDILPACNSPFFYRTGDRALVAFFTTIDAPTKLHVQLPNRSTEEVMTTLASPGSPSNVPITVSFGSTGMGYYPGGHLPPCPVYPETRAVADFGTGSDAFEINVASLPPGGFQPGYGNFLLIVHFFDYTDAAPGCADQISVSETKLEPAGATRLESGGLAKVSWSAAGPGDGVFAVDVSKDSFRSYYHFFTNGNELTFRLPPGKTNYPVQVRVYHVRPCGGIGPSSRLSGNVTGSSFVGRRRPQRGG